MKLGSQGMTEAEYAAFARGFLDAYLAGGLGTMGKRDTEVLVVHLLNHVPSVAAMSNHALALKLKTTDTKLKNLRNEAVIKHCTDHEQYVRDRFWGVLAAQGVRVDERGLVRVVIEDQFVRTHLEATLKSMGEHSDTSFNREILVMNAAGLSGLLVALYPADEIQRFEKALAAKKAGSLEQFLDRVLKADRVHTLAQRMLQSPVWMEQLDAFLSVL